MTAEITAETGRAAWTTRALPEPTQSFVKAGGDHLESRDPATGELVAVVRTSTAQEVAGAVERARAAFSRGGWRSDGAQRARALYGFADSLRANQKSLAELLTREQGKTIHEARLEIAGSADMTEYYAGLARALYGRSMVLKDDVQSVVLREPVGVVAVITPWNWPLTLLVRSLAPALAAGNACIVKPASLTPAITVAALELLDGQPDMPPGILSCVIGSGGEVGHSLVGSDGVDMIAFTGETQTGISVMKRAAEGLRKVALELGGKSPNIVFGDADMDKALAGTENAIFTTCGQICTAGSRLLVEERACDEFVSRLADITRNLRVGDGLDESSQLGAVVSARQQEIILDYVEAGRKEGTLVTGGNPLNLPPYEGGNFVAPALFTDLPPESRLIQEEIFGPVLTVQSFSDDDEAIALANSTDYGLAAGVWTQNLNRAWRVGRAIDAGTVWVNTYHHFYPEAEVGGYKHSGIGRQQGVEGIHEFTETKHINFDGSPTLW